MNGLLFSNRAAAELDEIWLYIAADNPAAANRLLDAIHAACNMLTDFPKLGPVVSDSPPLRYLSVGRYLVIYRLLRGTVEVTRVVHSARYLPRQ